MFKYLYKLQTLVITAVLFFTLWLISLFPFKDFDFLTPIGGALSDFQLTDMVFSKFRDPNVPIDTNVVIVNIGRLNRKDAATQIRRISRARPKVIGIDAFWRQEKEPALDTPLSNAIREAGNIVLVHELWGYDSLTKKFRTTRTSAPIFNKYAQNGYANVTTSIVENNVVNKTARSVAPKTKVGDTTELSFAVKLVSIYRPEAAKACLAREREQEIINWRGNIGEKFFFLDTEASMDTANDLSLLRGKIVLMAYVELDQNSRTLEDMYFTPLNEFYAGKSFPDMYGIGIHANMISMMLDGSYINVMPEWLGMLLAILLCYVNVALFTYIQERHPKWFDLGAVLIPILYSLLGAYLIIQVFINYRYELQINLILLVLVLGPTFTEIVLPFYEYLYERLTRAKTSSTT